MMLPVRTPQSSGHQQHTGRLRPASHQLTAHSPDEVVPTAPTLYVPNRRWVARRAEVLVQLARGSRMIRAYRQGQRP